MTKSQALAAFSEIVQDERVDGKRISHNDRNYRFLLGLPLSRGLGVMGHGESWEAALESARAHVGLLEEEAAKNDAIELANGNTVVVGPVAPGEELRGTESSPQVAPAETNEGNTPFNTGGPLTQAKLDYAHAEELKKAGVK